MKITRNQIRKIIKEISSAPRTVRIDDIEELKQAIVGKIVQMMPSEEAASMSEDNLKGLITTVYDRFFDPENEGWDPYPEDIEDIRDNLTVTPLPGDSESDIAGAYDPEEHDRNYRFEKEYDESGFSGNSFEFKKK